MLSDVDSGVHAGCHAQRVEERFILKETNANEACGVNAKNTYKYKKCEECGE